MEQSRVKDMQKVFDNFLDNYLQYSICGLGSGLVLGALFRRPLRGLIFGAGFSGGLAYNSKSDS